MRLFLSYSHSDSGDYADHLYSELAKHFGEMNVSMFKKAIRPEDRQRWIQRSLERCDVLIAVIGKNWESDVALGERQPASEARLVEEEITAAIARGIPVLPALVAGAMLPRPESLPASLGALSNRVAFVISDAGFERDVDRMVVTLQGLIEAVDAPGIGTFRRVSLEPPALGRGPLDKRKVVEAILIMLTVVVLASIFNRRLVVPLAVSLSGLFSVGLLLLEAINHTKALTKLGLYTCGMLLLYEWLLFWSAYAQRAN